MAIDTASPRSRRALLGAALGAGAAFVASALGRPLPASAADGQTVLVGGEYVSTSVTKIDGAVGGQTVLWGASNGGIGIVGTGGATGTGVSGVGSVGVRAEGSSLYGVYSTCTSGTGVFAYSDSATFPGVVGHCRGNTGVQGYSGTSTRPAGSPKTGVYGYAAQDETANGVRGQTTIGRGVLGVATSGLGVYGLATSGTAAYGNATTGIGTRGYATTGMAGYFSTSGLKSGLALRTYGRVRFDNSVGIATVAAGMSTVTVTPGIDLTAASAVVATLQGSAGGTTSVNRVVVNATADTFVIHLTANATAAVKVAWHVFG